MICTEEATVYIPVDVYENTNMNLKRKMFALQLVPGSFGVMAAIRGGVLDLRNGAIMYR
jgi:hypothetical protein